MLNVSVGKIDARNTDDLFLNKFILIKRRKKKWKNEREKKRERFVFFFW